MTYSPIAIFTYNRLAHTKKTIFSLLNNTLANKSDIYIYSDGPRNVNHKDDVEKVRDFLKSISGFCNIHLNFSKENKGLADSIIHGVTEIFQSHSSVIVLEDDLETSPYFLSYMNDVLLHYNPDKIWSVAGYSPDIRIPEDYNCSTYLAHRNCSWGWATWKQNWEQADWNITDFNVFFKNKTERKRFERGGNDLSVMLLKQQQQKVNSWSIRYNYAAFKCNLPTVYPTYSMVKNIGVDGSGTNMKKSQKYLTSIYNSPIDKESFCSEYLYDIFILKQFRKFYNTSIIRAIINWFKTNYTLYV